MPIKTLSYGPEAWKYLKGIFCVYKPAGVASMGVRHSLCLNLCKGLNELEQREPQGLVSLKGSACLNKPYEVELLPNYADHPLVSGPRYQVQDIKMAYVQPLGLNTSGVFLMAVNDACWQVSQQTYRFLLRKYEVKGKFGASTSTCMADGIVRERTTYHHIKESALDRVLGTIQTTHQSLAFKYSDVNIRSQDAYELASRGLVKPTRITDPLIYNIRCTEFNPPHFTLEIHCVNETEAFLAGLIHDLGMDLKSTAACVSLRQVQFGPFRIPHALLRKHWTLENVLSNITLCREILKECEDPSSSAQRLVRSIGGASQDCTIEEMREAARQEECV